jgi:flagellar motor switch protein FliN/FliY
MPQDSLCSAPDSITVSRRGSLPIFRELPPRATPAAGCDLTLLGDIELDVRIELGRTNMRLDDVLKLTDGSVLELDRLAGDTVDVFVTDRLVARGQVVVLNKNLAVRITEVVSPMCDGQKI